MNSFLSEGHVAIQAVGWTLLHFLWQGTLIGLIYAALRPWLPSGRGRYGAALVALALLVLLPAFTLWQLLASASADVVLPAVAAVVAPGSDVAAQASGTEAWLPWLVGAWAVGVLVLTARALMHWHRLLQLMRNAHPLPQWEARLTALLQRFSIRRAVRLLWSEQVETPTLVGWLRPVILLPASVALGFPAAQIELILAHELGHVRRWDYAVNLIQVMLETVLFYHPVVHWISRELRHEREICCDDLVLRVTGSSPHVYARTLANLEELRDPMHLPLAVAASGGVLLHRVQRIAGIVPSPAMTARPAARLMTLTLAGLVLVAGIAQQQMKPDSALATMPWQLARLLTTGKAAAPRLQVANLVTTPEWGRMKLNLGDAAPLEPAPVEAVASAPVADAVAMPLPLPALAKPRADLASIARTHLSVDAPVPTKVLATLLPVVTAAAAARAPMPVKVVQPVYPEAARERGVEGVVTLEFELGSSGEVLTSRVVSAEPERVFDTAALQALRWWRYDPSTIRAGVRYQQNFVFSLGQNNLPKMESTEEVSAEAECRIVTGSRLCRRADGTEDAARSHGAELISVH